jgi:hypothetical protein
MRCSQPFSLQCFDQIDDLVKTHTFSPLCYGTIFTVSPNGAFTSVEAHQIVG